MVMCLSTSQQDCGWTAAVAVLTRPLKHHPSENIPPQIPPSNTLSPPPPCACALQAAAKRYKVTGSGKVVARHSGKQHMNEKQTRQKKRDLAKSFVVSPSDIYKASRCLPYADLQ